MGREEKKVGTTAWLLSFDKTPAAVGIVPAEIKVSSALLSVWTPGWCLMLPAAAKALLQGQPIFGG